MSPLPNAKIDLEEFARTIGWTEKHADYVIVTQRTIAVVEETKTAKKDDIEKLDKTIEAIRNGPLKNHMPKSDRIIAIIHAEKRTDPMIPKLILSRNNANTIYRIANCDEKLREILKQHGLDP